jgi:hypothetical protein
MNSHRDDNPERNPNEWVNDPLPSDFAPALHEVDDHVGRLLRAQAEAGAPDGMVDRIVAASSSIEMEASRDGRISSSPADPWRPVLTGAPRSSRPIHRRSISRFLGTARGQFAMAASLGIAFLMSVLFLRQPVVDVQHQPGMPGVPDVAYVFEDAAYSVLALEEPESKEYREVAYLLETGSLGFDELAGEMESILAGLEM